MTEAIGKTLSPKAVAGTAGAGAGAIVTTAGLWAIGGAISGDWTAGGVENALGAVPGPVAALVGLVVAVAFTFIPAWFITDHVRDVGAGVIDHRVDDIPGEVEGNVITHTPDGALDAGPRPPTEESDAGTYTGQRGR